MACYHRFSINIIGLSEHHLLERVGGALPAGFEKTMENLALDRLSVTTHPVVLVWSFLENSWLPLFTMHDAHSNLTSSRFR